MASYHYGQGYHGSAGQTPGAPPGSYYAGSQYGGHPGQPQYGGPAPGAPYGPPQPSGNGYGQPAPGGSAPGGPGGTYGASAPGGPYQTPGNNPYWGHQQGQQSQYGQRGPSGNIPPGVDPEAFSWFQTVDTDRSGYITLKELKQALVNSNWSTFNDETCIMMLNMFDKSHSGRIDLHGFSGLWTYLGQWRNLFQQYDRDRSGCINHAELYQALVQMGYKLSPQFVQHIMSQYAQRSANPTLQLDHFIQVCTKLQSMTEAFRDKDTERSGNARLSYDDFLTMAVGRLL